MRRKIYQYVRSCHKCQIINLQKTHFIDLHQNIVQTPQDHVSIDLLGPYNITSQGKSYTLTPVYNLTGYLMTTSNKDKQTMTDATHLFPDIMVKFGCYRILHSDNGMEFKYRFIESLQATWH